MQQVVAKCEVIQSTAGSLHAFRSDYTGPRPAGRQIAALGARIRGEYIPIYQQAEEALFAKKSQKHAVIDPEDIEIIPGQTPSSMIYNIAIGMGIEAGEAHTAFTRSRQALIDTINERREIARKEREAKRASAPARARARKAQQEQEVSSEDGSDSASGESSGDDSGSESDDSGSESDDSGDEGDGEGSTDKDE